MEKPSKAVIKRARELLRDKSARDESGLFVAEGLKIISDLASRGSELVEVICSAGFVQGGKGGRLITALEDRSVPVFTVSDTDLDNISSLQTSQGILATVKQSPAAAPITAAGDADLVVLCDGIQDPGNMGTIVRTSVAFGVRAILSMNDCADIYNPKVVRASSGTILDARVQCCDISELERLKEIGFTVLAAQADADSERVEKLKDEKGPLVLAFGSEGRGISREVADRADTLFAIPITDAVESLNVTAAVAIALYLFSRR